MELIYTVNIYELYVRKVAETFLENIRNNLIPLWYEYGKPDIFLGNFCIQIFLKNFDNLII